MGSGSIFRLSLLYCLFVTALATPAARGDLVTLVEEDFTTAFPTSQPGVTWNTNDTSFERYSSGGAAVRDMNSTYDHDNDGGTAEINIPGALEVNANSGNRRVRALFDLPANTDHTQNATLTFYAGLRNGDGGTSATVRVRNITDSRNLLVNTVVTTNSNDNIWEFNLHSLDIRPSDIGDRLQIRFIGGGTTSANGLELTGVRFSVTTAPEPSALWFVAMLAAAGIRNRSRSRNHR